MLKAVQDPDLQQALQRDGQALHVPDLLLEDSIRGILRQCGFQLALARVEPQPLDDELDVGARLGDLAWERGGGEEWMWRWCREWCM